MIPDHSSPSLARAIRAAVANSNVVASSKAATDSAATDSRVEPNAEAESSARTDTLSGQRVLRAGGGTAAGLAAILLVVAALFAAIDMVTIHREVSRMTGSQVATVRDPPALSKSTPAQSTPAPTIGAPN